MWALYSRASRCRCVVKGISVWARRAGEAGSLPASRNAAAGLKKQEAPAVRMHQVDVNWRPRFLPLVELLPLPLPPFLPLSLFFFLRTNATFLPSVICSADSPSGPWRTPPCNLSTPGVGLFTQRWLGAPRTALVTSPPLLRPHSFSLLSPSFLHSYSLLASLCSPHWGSCALTTHPFRAPLKHPQWDGGRRCSAEAQAAEM